MNKTEKLIEVLEEFNQYYEEHLVRCNSGFQYPIIGIPPSIAKKLSRAIITLKEMQKTHTLVLTERLVNSVNALSPENCPENSTREWCLAVDSDCRKCWTNYFTGGE